MYVRDRAEDASHGNRRDPGQYVANSEKAWPVPFLGMRHDV
jgi:hypothetical protein